MKEEQRSICPHCEFIQARCLCVCLSTINNLTKIIILQHPSESKHALNTVKILRKSLINLEIFIGENFSKNQDFQKILNLNHEKIALVFPQINDEPNSSKLLDLENLSDIDIDIKTLIILDGTWKKAKKIYYLNPILNSLPRLILTPSAGYESLYQIRKSQHDFGVSTLEACVMALAMFEKTSTESLMISMKKMIEFQVDQIKKKKGEEVFQINYLSTKK